MHLHSLFGHVYMMELLPKVRAMKDIRVEFRDQEGVDAVALTLDFFELLLNEVEGQSNSLRVPFNQLFVNRVQ